MTQAKFLKSGIAAAAMVLFAASSQAGPVLTQQRTSLNLAINDFSSVSNTINFSESAWISSLTVSVGVDHTWIGDLVYSLEHAGKTVTLMNRNGGGSNLSSAFALVFSDAAAKGISSVGAGCGSDLIGSTSNCLNTSFKPSDALTAFKHKKNSADLFGNINGAWTLTVADNAGADKGKLVSWSINANVVPEPSSLALLPLALGGAFFASRRRKAAAK